VKQVLQSLKDGHTELAEIPAPQVRRGQLLIASSRTLISPGTERSLVSFGKANFVQKARLQPDKVRMVVEKIRTDGLVPTLEAVLGKLDQPLPMGYSNVGTVVAVGEGVLGFAVGDRVVSNGKHAEIVSVPVNLCAKVSDGVGDDAAAFAVLGAIALQGIRLAQPTLGEAVVVTGLGLVGLLAVQLLRAHGCRVLGLDYDANKLELARRFGAETVDLSREDALVAAKRFSRERGVDAVLITAATSSNEPVHQAALMSRKRGRIVLVGVAGLELSRADFYEKELTFQVSCSYGPGRYDPVYEERGIDYPVGFVRWTEQRNLEAVLDMLADGRLDVAPLVSHRFPIDKAVEAYEVVDGDEPSLAILLDYPRRAEELLVRATALDPEPAVGGVGRAEQRDVGVSFIGAGNYATAVLIEAFRTAGARLVAIASTSGVSAAHAGKKFGFATATTDAAGILADAETAAVVVATRHDSHAALTCSALRAGKHVFVEKPLALSVDELDQIEAAYREAAAGGRSPQLMVGFNRRFAPHVARIAELLRGVGEPKVLVMTVNAGAVPAGHWTQDPAVGGGRIVGEACHFIDLLRFLAASPVVAHTVVPMRSTSGDTVTISLSFRDGSIGTIHYLANGNKGVEKERLEVFTAGRVLRLDNFRRLTGYGWPAFKRLNLWRQDKGQRACARAFVAAIERGAPAPIPLDELLEVARVTIAVREAAAR
jgi:predicted dehydrogenase/threonine dehydrogenase-like Zn-dependent dehydrogenase